MFLICVRVLKKVFLRIELFSGLPSHRLQAARCTGYDYLFFTPVLHATFQFQQSV